MISADRSALGMAVLLGVCGPWLCIDAAHADGTFFKNRQAAVTAAAPAPAPTTPALGVRPGEASRAAPEPAKTAALAPAAGNPPPAPASTAPNEISGAVSDVLSTDTMIVAGQRVQLAGLRGTPSLAAPFRRWIQGHGGQLSCHALAGRYQCTTPNGLDVGRVLLLNGAAECDAGAPAEYQLAQQQARQARRGLWAQR